MKKQKQSKTSKKESLTSTLKKSEEIVVKEYSHDELMKALYWAWDAFDRAQMGMFLVYDTAINAMNNGYQKGERVEVGTRLS
jgi:hypothetical protein